MLLINYATPKAQREFQEKVNNHIRYKFKGKKRSGDIAPVLSEVKLYDVRIKKEHMADFLRDIGADTMNAPVAKAKGPWYSGHYISTISKIVRLGRKLVGLKNPPEKSPGERLPEMKGVQTIYVVGMLPDMETKAGNEVL